MPQQSSDVPTTEPARPRRAARLYALDGLRLVAALSVVSFHWTADAGVPEIWGGRVPADFMPRISGVTSYGWLGVQLFFLISGFVICMSCWGRTAGDFFLSRVIRIFPAYWAAILLTAAVLLLTPSLGRPGARIIELKMVLANFTMFPGQLGFLYVDGVYWTLWMELQFYLLFAIVVAKGLTYRRAVAFCGIWTVAGLLAPETGIPLLKTLMMPDQSPYFIAGVAMFLMYRFGPNLLLWGIVGFSWLLAITRIDRIKPVYDDASGHTLSWSVVAVVVTLCFLLIIGVALGAFNWVRWKGLTIAGALTYPLYLIHQEAGWTFIHWLRAHGFWSGTALALALAAALISAWLLHRLVERPLSNVMKNGLKKSLAAMRAASDGPRAQ
ncbi:acyltransferase family protein [Kitasatospora sp. NPDC057223]|uniref:acyltransferase family protein n=1 Tax=Kitasatospora sp. NPDC057223 TaxID=3346055 RepID=UPI00362F6542